MVCYKYIGGCLVDFINIYKLVVRLKMEKLMMNEK